ncbi:hypothetical protein CY35_06G014800 [Sphagnum magellanicum]|nr:hypothetical protein CY35_06G014800 [Sphagnum magellanicum]
MAMERRVLHMTLFLAVLLVAAASAATARDLPTVEKAVVGDTESQPSTLHPGVFDDDEFKKQQLAEGTHSEVSDEGKSVEDNNSDEEELAEDNDDDDGFNDEDKKTNHHSKPPKKTHHHKKANAADDSNSNDETEDANP